jgi:uncharacterized protein YndB with AHSA1/START domain
MGRFELDVTINRPPADVFAVVGDPHTMPRWYDAVQHVADESTGPSRVGSRYRVIRALPNGRAENEVEVTEYEPNRLLTLESRAGPTPFRYRYELAPTPEGTHLVLAGEISAEGLVRGGAPFDAMATRLFKRGMRHNLHVLKEVVETRGYR